MKIRLWIPACITIVLWWAVVFPEFALTEDAYRVLDKEGQEAILSDRDKEHVYEEILHAQPSEIKVRSALLEYLREMMRNAEEEELTGNMKKDAKITINGMQMIDGESFETTSETIGTYEQKENIHILAYSETSEDGEVENRVEVSENRVRVMKRGAIEAIMEFIPGEKHSFGYKISQGEIPFIALGGRIQYNVNVCAFHTEFDYTLFAGDFAQECKMIIDAEFTA